ncbi:MAG: glycine dehydrogenase (aminomethyl-transferring), partial [Shewanella putrefaciens]|nr:glycine dehydrogenase (aminomethyl-transferring) [Shewanella putrefaciens]
MTKQTLTQLEQHDLFLRRHIGPDSSQQQAMLNYVGAESLDDLTAQIVPESIRLSQELSIGDSCGEAEGIAYIRGLAKQNQVFKSYIGMGYYGTQVPNVILRNVLENPGWYTAYTPYQPEIAQGRLEAILNFQQVSMDLTGLDLASASLLDEATAAAEAMALAKRVSKAKKANIFFVADDVFPQTLDVVKTRAECFGFEVVVGPASEAVNHELFGALFQYTNRFGQITDFTELFAELRAKNVIVTVAADIMSLVLLKSPGAMGADVVFGSAQRFGVPMGFGGPHAAFFVARDEHKRSMPGRIIGVSKDARGNRALRMAMQTREQHIRREKANSNICTAQILLANMASFYAVFHGPDGLKTIASRIHRFADILAAGLQAKGVSLVNSTWFDTLSIKGLDVAAVNARALAAEMNLRFDADGTVGVSLDETTLRTDIDALFDVILGAGHGLDVAALDAQIVSQGSQSIPAALVRQDAILSHPTFNRYQSETEMMRYIKRLESKDLALNYSMISLGSCTMKLNAAVEMIPVSWPEFANMHPFCPLDQAKGY